MAGEAFRDPDEEVELHLVFEYLLQKVPTRTNRKVLTRPDSFNVYLRLAAKNLDEKGHPDPRALWFAERMFLTEVDKKHLPDVRLLRWTSRLADEAFILSSYEVLLSASVD